MIIESFECIMFSFAKSSENQWHTTTLSVQLIPSNCCKPCYRCPGNDNQQSPHFSAEWQMSKKNSNNDNLKIKKLWKLLFVHVYVQSSCLNVELTIYYNSLFIYRYTFWHLVFSQIIMRRLIFKLNDIDQILQHFLYIKYDSITKSIWNPQWAKFHEL